MAAQATHVCGGGAGPDEILAGVQPGGNGIAPTPLCYWKSGSQQQPAGPQWETRWGAIAIDKGPTNAGLGAATGMASKRRAEKAAIADCKAKGGADCKVSLAYHNQCAVVVAGYYAPTRGYSIAQGAATPQEAARIGLRECNKDGVSGCTLYYSDCSYAEQVQ